MEQLLKRLQKDIARTNDTKLVDTVQWTIPMQRLSVCYAPVERLSMDILMKMLLLTFDELHITSLHTISELLAVEHLFVEDLTNNLIRNGLVALEENVYTLTARGHEQLASGIFENAQQDEQILITYSPLHDAYFTEDVTALYDLDLPEPYAHVEEAIITATQPPTTSLLTLLQQQHSTDTHIKTYVSSVKDIAQTEIVEVPCIAFILYNEKDDTFSTRVWNTLLQRYDDVLEAYVLEHEIAQWRKTYI